jgi:methionyl-tRNA formyltransferase
MRVVFMGTPAFAVPSLEAVATSHDLAAVYCAPDRRSGRGRHVTPSPAKTAAQKLGLPVVQPRAFDADAIEELAAFAPDVITVAAYGAILPADVLTTPPRGAVNVHASLLPRHRGAAPIERAILDGDATTGVSIMRMEPSLDTGPVAEQVEVEVGERDADSLAEELAARGAEALVAVLADMEAGNVRWVPQNDERATYAAKITAADVALSPDLPTEQFLRRVRASSRRAPARLVVCGCPAVIVSASPADAQVPAGRVSTDADLVLGTSDGAVRVERMRPENRREMPGNAFVCGLQGEAEEYWRSTA